MPITGNFSLQTVFFGDSGFDTFGKQELQNISTKGLSQAHSYIFTSWNPSWNPKTLKDFTGLGRPELQNTITVPSPSPSWDSIRVDFNITALNNIATLASPNIQITVGSMNTKVSVDYFIGNDTVNEFPSTGFNTYDHNISYSTTGNQTLTFTPDSPSPNTYQLRLRYYNKFNELSTPGSGNPAGSNFDQSVVPAQGSVGVTTPPYPTLPPPLQSVYRYFNDNPRDVQVVWLYQNVLSNGQFTTGTGYQPPTYSAQVQVLGSYVDGSLVSNSSLNWGSTSNFNKSARWNNANDITAVSIRANSDSDFQNSSFVEAELYQYPTVTTDTAILLSTTSIRLRMTLGNISGYNVVYFWQYRVAGNTDWIADVGESTTNQNGQVTFDLGVNANTNFEFRALVRRETDVFVTVLGVNPIFVSGVIGTISTDIRPSSVTQGLSGSGGFVTLTVTWSHPPAYSNGLPTGGTYTVQILNSASQLVTQVTGIAGTTTSHDFTNICSLLSDGDYIKSKVIANIPNNIGTGERLADNFIEVAGCATENGGGNGGIGGGL